jgi:hypothetical protein
MESEGDGIRTVTEEKNQSAKNKIPLMFKKPS